jgi:hypothetical protein
MQHLIFGVGAGAIVLLAARAYRFERWNRRRRVRGALECLDAVHNTLASLAERKSIEVESKNYAVLHVPQSKHRIFR